MQENTLLEGNYKIVEVIDDHDGWYNVGQQGCTFYYDGGNHPDFSCTFGNAKYGKIIINKQKINLMTVFYKKLEKHFVV